MSWRSYSDWAKTRPMTLRLADRLGRGRGRVRWFDRLNPPPPALRPDLSNWTRHELAAVWIGHATVLLRIGDKTILTDPVMSQRVGVGFGLVTAGPRRLIAPALSFHQLPKIDLILVSHAHFDHLDLPTLNRFPRRVPIVTSEHNQDLIRELGFINVTELRWGESMELDNLTIRSHEVRHWGARTFHDGHRGFAAFSIASPRHRILYGGDTAYHEGFKEVGKTDLAILGIGAYDPYVRAHATPEQAWQMADHLRADYLLPMHHSTFRLSYEPPHEPIERLLTVAGQDDQRIIIRRAGEQWTMD